MRNRSFVQSWLVATWLALGMLAWVPEAHAAIESTDEPSPRAYRDVQTEAVRADRPSAEATERRTWEDHDHVRVGALLGLGFPRPFALQGLVKIERAVGLGVEVGMMPPIKIGALEGSFWGIAGDLRVFPFQGAFFLGLRAGYQRMKATASTELPIIGTLSESAVAETWFVNPRLGFLWTFESGLSVGLDAGVQVPVQKSFVDSLPEGLPVDVRGSLTGVANTFGQSVVPTVDLLRIGFLF